MVRRDRATLSTMVDYAERLQAAISHAGVTSKALQDHLKISYQAMKKVEDGKTKSLSAENNARAARFLGVDSFWLATGEDSMILSQTELQSQKIGYAQVAQESMQAHDFAWPFETISYTEFQLLSERQKGLVEGYTKKLIDDATPNKSNSI